MLLNSVLPHYVKLRLGDQRFLKVIRDPIVKEF